MPDPGDPQSLNRYSYVLNNPLKYGDPSGHTACAAFAPMAPVVVGCQVIEQIMLHGPEIMALIQQLTISAPMLPAAADPVNDMTQAIQSLGGNTAGPGGLDPRDPFNGFLNLIRDKGSDKLQQQLQSSDTAHRIGAERVLKVMDKLGNRVKQVNVPFKGANRAGDVDILETTGNIHTIGSHYDPTYLGGHFQYLQQFITSQGTPNATITYWFTGSADKLAQVLQLAERWGIKVEILQ